MNLKGEVRAVHCFSTWILLRRQMRAECYAPLETRCFHCLRFGLPRGVAAFPGTGVSSIVGELRFSWWHFIQDTREPASCDGDQEGQQRRSGSVCSAHVRQIGSCLRKSRDIWDGQFTHVAYGLYILDSMFIGFQCLSRQNVRNAFPSCQFNWDFSQIFSQKGSSST